MHSAECNSDGISPALALTKRAFPPRARKEEKWPRPPVSPQNESDAQFDRRHRKRDGVDSAGRISLDYLCRSGGRSVPVGNDYVGRHLHRVVTGVRNRGLLFRTRAALPRRGQFVSVRRTGLPEQNPRVQAPGSPSSRSGWGAHLYYWVYPGAMVATIGIMIGYIVGQFAPNTINAGTPGSGFHGDGGA